MLDLTIEDPPIEDVIESCSRKRDERRSRGLPVAHCGGGRLRSLLDTYLTSMRLAIQAQFQYRVANYLYMIGMVAEPVIYLVVWTTIAEQQGGSVDGITAGQLAAYYIVWTLVRSMNIVFTRRTWEWRIREGELSARCSARSILHYDLAFFAGWKFVVIILWLPIAAVLALIFHPQLHRRCSKSPSSSSPSGARS